MAGTGEEPLNRELYRIPGHAGWFSWNNIHAIERESLVEFFEGKTLSKTPKIYKDYRDFMINKYRENPRRNLSFTELRKMLIGDVNCLRRVFDFLEKWGLINNSQLFADSPDGLAPPTTSNITSSTPASPPVVSVAPPGLQIVHKSINLGSRENAFQKVGNKAQQGEEWSQQELMLLLEAVSKHGDNWTRVQQHVGTKTKSQCVKQFVQLPFGDQFLSDDGELPLHVTSKSLENGSAPQQQQQQQQHPAKKQKMTHSDGKVKQSSQQSELLEEIGITPLCDSSNPILSQIAFMSAMVGPRVAAAAAEAALAVIAEEEPAVAQLSLLKEAKEHKEKDQKEHHKEQKEVHKEEHDQRADSDSSGHEAGTAEALHSDEQGDEVTIKEQTRISAAQMRAGLATALAAAAVNAKHKANQEEREIELLMANIIETQLKKLQSKVEHFEELEHLMEKERLQLEQMREQVFIDRIQLMRQHFPGGSVAVNAPGSSHQEKLA